MRPIETENESCLSCKFWAGTRPERQEDDSVKIVGQCRKASPVMNADGSPGWPKTEAHDWCAQYVEGATPEQVRRFL